MQTEACDHLYQKLQLKGSFSNLATFYPILNSAKDSALSHVSYTAYTLITSFSNPHPPGVLDVSNSFAVPFDEDDRDPDVYFLDHDYLESMYTMFKKVNAKEKIVGWFVRNILLENEPVRYRRKALTMKSTMKSTIESHSNTDIFHMVMVKMT